MLTKRLWYDLKPFYMCALKLYEVLQQIYFNYLVCPNKCVAITLNGHSHGSAHDRNLSQDLKTVLFFFQSKLPNEVSQQDCFYNTVKSV